jgi:hypothetical protein
LSGPAPIPFSFSFRESKPASREARTCGGVEPLSFDEFVDLLRVRPGAADVLKPPGELHEFKSLFSAEDAEPIPDNWCEDAFDELEAQGHLDPAAKTFGPTMNARLSADGRLYLRTQADA